ncbi:hypothetical protein [Catelliglobosispora koreensis]|uniref:hypothetical protein n=1 Tax=Catelliglobosispora koreensis TaxID=129052 RepID=UPI00037014E7|nr:hypothetical protein [Catelliglobosispora koreensis]
MSEIDDAIREALTSRAGDPVHVEDLLSGARRRGMRQRRLRHAMFGTGAVALVLTAALTVSLVGTPKGNGDNGLQPATAGPVKPAPTASPSESPQKLLTARPPLATGETGPSVLRLDVTDPEVSMLEWKTRAHWQKLNVGRVPSVPGPVSGYTVGRADSAAALMTALGDGGEAWPGERSTEPLTVYGRPATLTYSIEAKWSALTWATNDGVHVGVFAVHGDIPASTVEQRKQAMLEVAGLVVLDKSYVCAVDFQLTWTPSGSELTGCQLGLMSDGHLFDQLTYGTFRVETLRLDGMPFVPNRTVDGREFELTDGFVRYRYGDRVAELSGDLNQSDALKVMGSFTPAT